MKCPQIWVFPVEELKMMHSLHNLDFFEGRRTRFISSGIFWIRVSVVVQRSPGMPKDAEAAAWFALRQHLRWEREMWPLAPVGITGALSCGSCPTKVVFAELSPQWNVSLNYEGHGAHATSPPSSLLARQTILYSFNTEFALKLDLFLTEGEQLPIADLHNLPHRESWRRTVQEATL